MAASGKELTSCDAQPSLGLGQRAQLSEAASATFLEDTDEEPMEVPLQHPHG